MANGKAIVTGFLVGGVVSAATALLVTPSSGKDLREQIKSQSGEWKRIVDDIIQDGIRLKNQIATTSKEDVALINELTDEMKTSIDEWKEAIEPHQENIHEYLEEIEASIKDLETKLSTQKES